MAYHTPSTHVHYYTAYPGGKVSLNTFHPSRYLVLVRGAIPPAKCFRPTSTGSMLGWNVFKKTFHAWMYVHVYLALSLAQPMSCMQILDEAIINPILYPKLQTVPKAGIAYILNKECILLKVICELGGVGLPSTMVMVYLPTRRLHGVAGCPARKQPGEHRSENDIRNPR